MDLESLRDNQNSAKKPTSKPAFGSPAIGFGSPAVVAFGSPAIQNSSYRGYAHTNKSPSPQPFPPNSSPGHYNSNTPRDGPNSSPGYYNSNTPMYGQNEPNSSPGYYSSNTPRHGQNGPNSSPGHYNSNTPRHKQNGPYSSPAWSPGNYHSNTPRDGQNGFIGFGSSPRNQYCNNRNNKRPKNSCGSQNNGFSPNFSDRQAFRPPHDTVPSHNTPGPIRGRGMGRKSKTWTYGQSPLSWLHNKKITVIEKYYSPNMVKDPWCDLKPVLAQN